MAVVRYPLASVATLAVYLTVNLGAGALHHHAGGQYSPTGSVADSPSLQARTPTSAEDDCTPDKCLLCQVLHTARTLSSAVRVEAVLVSAGEAIAAVARARPHSLETATHPRAPPAAP